jgi:hypothetical protein
VFTIGMSGKAPDWAMHFSKSSGLLRRPVARSPFAYRVLRREARRYLLARFPFLFTVRNDTVVIVACLHVRRAPAEVARSLGR